MLPNRWRKSAIADVAIVVTGTTPSTSDESNYGNDYLFVTPGDLGKTKYITAAVRKISKQGLKRSRLIPHMSSLFTCIGATIGKVGLAGKDVTTNQQINAVIPKLIESEYLYYALCYIAQKIKRLAGAQAVPIVNKSTFENEIILVPSDLNEQKLIADLLSTWDSATETTERLIETKEKHYKWLLNELIYKGTNQNGWNNVKLGQLFDEVTEKVGERVIPPFSISAGIGFVSQKEKWGKDIAGKQYQNYVLLQKGGFAYNKGNSKKYKCGCAYLLKEHAEIAVPNVFISFKRKTKSICSEFYEHYFIADHHARELRKYISSSARSDGLLNLNKKDFFKILVPNPPADKQKAISNALTTAREEIVLFKRLADKYKE